MHEFCGQDVKIEADEFGPRRRVPCGRQDVGGAVACCGCDEKHHSATDSSPMADREEDDREEVAPAARTVDLEEASVKAKVEKSKKKLRATKAVAQVFLSDDENHVQGPLDKETTEELKAVKGTIDAVKK